MRDLLVVAIGIFIVVGGAVVRRRKVGARRGQAATVELTIDRTGVRRRLADGRSESAEWASTVSVEIVCTPVRTADGASAFALIAEGPETGCLVPLGVGHDDDLLVQLGRLSGFRTEHYVAALEHKAPKRTVIWESPATSGP